MASEAAELIERLVVDQGMTQRQVAAAMGRDPAIVSRVRAGKQPGTSYVGFLRNLAGGRVARPPAHRQGGDVPTAVRTVRSGNVVTGGRPTALVSGHDAVAGLRSALAASDPQRKITLTIEGVDPHGKPWTRELFPNGWRAGRFRAALDHKVQSRGYDPRGTVPADVIAESIHAVADDAGDHGYSSGNVGTGVTTSYSVGVA